MWRCLQRQVCPVEWTHFNFCVWVFECMDKCCAFCVHGVQGASSILEMCSGQHHYQGHQWLWTVGAACNGKTQTLYFLMAHWFPSLVHLHDFLSSSLASSNVPTTKTPRCHSTTQSRSLARSGSFSVRRRQAPSPRRTGSPTGVGTMMATFLLRPSCVHTALTFWGKPLTRRELPLEEAPWWHQPCTCLASSVDHL